MYEVVFEKSQNKLEVLVGNKTETIYVVLYYLLIRSISLLSMLIVTVIES